MSKHPPQPTWTGKDKPKKKDKRYARLIDGYINYGLACWGYHRFILIKK
jgi:hypothetical protein